MVPEAPLERTDAGIVPSSEGWFVVNAREARWFENDDFGAFTIFEGNDAARFEQFGNNIGVFEPGKPACMYHREAEQEDFLVLAIGARTGGGVTYPVSDLARRYGASVEQETQVGEEAYAGSARSEKTPYREGWLP